MQPNETTLLVSILFHITIIITLGFLGAFAIPMDSFRSSNYYFKIILI